MTLRRVRAVASDNSRRCYRKAAVGFRIFGDNPPLPAFTSFPSSRLRREESAWYPSLPRLRRDESSNSCAGRRTSEHCALSAMLTVSQLSKSFAGRALFDDVSLQVNRGDRMGA